MQSQTLAAGERGSGIRPADSSLALLLTCLILLIVNGGCSAGADQPGEEQRERRMPLVEAVQARSGTLPLEQRLSGVVKARNQVSVRAEISARVVEVPVRSGEAVQRGQVLVRLDDASLQDQLRQAEAAVLLTEAAAREAAARVAELRAQVVRSRAMAEQELISELELETQEARLQATEAAADQAEARVAQARATLEERRTARERSVVRAPAAGHVGQRLAEVGMLTSPGTMLFVLGDLDELTVEVPLSERMLSFVEEGQTARISSDALGEAPVQATLTRVSPFLEEGSFSTIGEIEIRNEGGRLRPGMFVTVDILYGESREATLVPTSALWEDPRSGELGIYVLAPVPSGVVPTATAETAEEERLAEFRRVGVLAEGRLSVGVEGVRAGEWVVIVGQNLLQSTEPSPVRVRPVTWERVVALQNLQREDLLDRFLRKQRRMAETIGAVPPDLGAGREPFDPPATETSTL